MSREERKRIFEAAHRAALTDLKGFRRAIVLLEKRDLDKMVEEIEKERKSNPLDIHG